MAHSDRFQDLFDEFSIRPVWVSDYPVVSQPDGYAPLAQYLADGRAEIGAHLHPWVTPPHEEEVSSFNSYPGNLAAELERKKLELLRDTIEQNLGSRPTVYKAGRYGFGSNTGATLAKLGFEIDMSPFPCFDLSGDGGPDYTSFPYGPFRFGPERSLLGLPNSSAFIGFLGRASAGAHALAHKPPFSWAHAGGILSRLGAVERLNLSPEGYELDDLKRLTDALLARGERTFVFSLHSPSALPGCTPYVSDEAGLQRFLDRCRHYFEYFLETRGGTPKSPSELRDILQPQTAR